MVFELFKYFKVVKFEVIFTTAYEQFALKAIKCSALDYLLKPININELKTAVEKAISSLDNNSNGTLLKKKYEVLRENRKNESFDFEKIALPTSDGIEPLS